MKVLVVEDERDLNDVICRQLKKHGYSADGCFNGEEAFSFLDVGEYDAVILDAMMPKLDGFQFLERLRNQGSGTPVLMLTAKGEIEDKISGLDKGADDYMVKPFEINELLARLRAIIRRRYGSATNIIEIDGLVVDLSKRTAMRSGEEILLTGKEYEVLEYLLLKKEHVVTRQQILDHVWDYSYEGDSNLIDVLIRNIRRKIDREGCPSLIRTKRGLGYVIKD